MKNQNFLGENRMKEALCELVGSFFFVFLYFVSIEHAIGIFSTFEIILGSVAYAVIYFTIVLFISEKAIVHLLPVVSFIELLQTENLTRFLIRVAAQFTGALFAVVLHIWAVKMGPNADLVVYAEPLDPFFTGLFSGFLSQAIYLLYFFNSRFAFDKIARFFILSIGLGITYVAVTLISSITLLNPFGLLLHYLFSGNPITINILLVGGLVHVVVPMLFIGGTHFFLKGFIFTSE